MKKETSYKKLFSGIDTPIALENGEYIVPINFDNAATTPPFKSVNESVQKNILMYGSIGRGKGHKSEYCTELYEESRNFLLDFFNLSNSDEYTCVYVKNTTEGINLLAKTLVSSKEDIVLLTRMEHHANDIPWRYSCKTVYTDVNKEGRIDLNNIEETLKKYKGKIKIVSVTGASNVTGYINDINEIARIAHKYGAKIVVDAAQLVAHRKINMKGVKTNDYIDFLVFSSHKMYAPFGSGVVVGNKDILDKGNMFLHGGGSVIGVLDEKVYFSNVPSKFEAGTPNFLGIVSIIEAVKSLTSIGFDNIEAHENDLRDYLIKKLYKMDSVVLYGDINDRNRLGVVPFNVYGIDDEIVAKKLADYRAVAVRHGGFCSHPYVRRLLNISEESAENYIINGLPQPGMVRASFGLYNTHQEIDEFVKAIRRIIKYD